MPHRIVWTGALLVGLGGCAVVTVVDTAVGVTATVVETAVDVTAGAVSGTVDLITGDDEDDDQVSD